MLRGAGCGASSAVLQCFLDARLRSLPRRNEAEGDGNEYYHRAAEEQDAAVHSNDCALKHVHRNQPAQPLNSESSHKNSQAAAEKSEEKTLGEHLTDQPFTARAAGLADGNFSGPGRSAHEKQISDVDAGDKENKHNGTEKHEDWRATVAYQFVSEGSHADYNAAVCGRILFSQIRSNRVHFRLVLDKRGTWNETADGIHVSAVSTLGHIRITCPDADGSQHVRLLD